MNMENFKPKETEFIGIIKKQIQDFIDNSEVLDDETKKAFKKELGSNWYDNRFDATKFIDDAVGCSVIKWQQHNFELSELWKQIAINNAKVSNEPYKVANETISKFKSEFNC
jgi:hypothetical protein